ncbi:two-component hybrid sensor and regulator [Calothrix sp. NIES-2100]|uniref:hybrid sensor histidine kinase/response regulator n=1 Tax=Calothrix sp. NIES-2100 TaxID=1954172 RepID=UPI000B620516|nr:two-component hybrid sensor and regulator [Calothrix sp. NIES-2100]
MVSISSKKDNSKKIQVLIVEDEFILAINLQESLESLGYTVVDIADSATAAIDKANQLRPNLILMDIRLQGEMDGIQAAEQIWNSLQIPIIYVTGHSDKSTVERATLTSPFGYILKPIREQELYVAIQTALNRYEREQFLSTVLREMGDGVIVVDTQLQVKYLNQVAEALTEWRLDEAKNRMFSEICQLIDQQTQLPIENPIVLALQSQTPIYLNDRILLVTKNGTKIPIADSVTAIKDRNGAIAGAVMVFRDNTQRLLIEERRLTAFRAQQLEIQMKELQQLNKLKEDFLATTSHEMRTPLSNIKMAISMLENILDKQGILNSETLSKSGSVTQYLNILRDQCEQELNLIDDLLEMRIIDADIYPLQLTVINLQNWLPHVIEGFEELIQAQQQILEVNIAPDLPPIVSDLNLLTRIVSELLNNAGKYTPALERITVNVQLIDNTKSLSNDAPEKLVQIIISNSGIELSPTEQSLIFDPFYRTLKSQTKDKSTIFDLDYQIPQSQLLQHSGTGLGLALVKKLVRYLQGTIEVTSTEGWTRFIVELPIKLN